MAQRRPRERPPRTRWRAARRVRRRARWRRSRWGAWHGGRSEGGGERERACAGRSVLWRGFRRNLWPGAGSRQRRTTSPGSLGQPELLDELVAVAAPDREDLALAEVDDRGDAGVGGASARVGDEAEE